VKAVVGQLRHTVGDEVKADKKRQKAEAKLGKKAAKAHLEETRATSQAPVVASEQPRDDGPSVGVRFAEIVKGVIYVVLAVSLGVALILGEGDVVITLDDIINSLLVAVLGKIILAIIALALLIYGLKQVRLVK
jgi:uncharacterized membrane protein YdbT with pleckstrin-like domain